MTTQSTSEKSALVLIDHQDRTMKLVKNIPVDDVRRFTLAFAKASKILDMPVVLGRSWYAAIPVQVSNSMLTSFSNEERITFCRA